MSGPVRTNRDLSGSSFWFGIENRFSESDGTIAGPMFIRRDAAPTPINGMFVVRDLNNAGAVVGNDFEVRAAVWRNGDVRVLPIEGQSGATAINARGWVVGNQVRGTEGGEFIVSAFLWDGHRNAVVNLAPQDVGSAAVDINDRGEIIGYLGSGPSLGVEGIVIWRVRP